LGKGGRSKKTQKTRKKSVLVGGVGGATKANGGTNPAPKFCFTYPKDRTGRRKEKNTQRIFWGERGPLGQAGEKILPQGGGRGHTSTLPNPARVFPQRENCGTAFEEGLPEKVAALFGVRNVAPKGWGPFRAEKPTPKVPPMVGEGKFYKTPKGIGEVGKNPRFFLMSAHPAPKLFGLGPGPQEGKGGAPLVAVPRGRSNKKNTSLIKKIAQPKVFGGSQGETEKLRGWVVGHP